MGRHENGKNGTRRKSEENDSYLCYWQIRGVRISVDCLVYWLVFSSVRGISKWRLSDLRSGDENTSRYSILARSIVRNVFCDISSFPPDKIFSIFSCIDTMYRSTGATSLWVEIFYMGVESSLRRLQ